MAPLLMLLANFAPLLTKYLGGNESTQKIAGEAANIAMTVAGSSTPEEAIEKMKASSELQIKFQEAVMDKSIEWDKLYLADVQSARQRDIEMTKAGLRNYRADSMYLLAVIVIIVLVWMVWHDETLNEYVKGVVTLVLGRFLGYLDGIYNFEFGSTRSSQKKDDTIKALSQ